MCADQPCNQMTGGRLMRMWKGRERGVWLVSCAVLGVIAALSLIGCQSETGVDYVSIWHQKTGGERDFFERVVGEGN